MKNPVTKTQAIWCITPMVSALALAMDVYVPAVPRIADLFHASTNYMQLTLTLFMLAAGILQLIIGPLSDQIGRKPSCYIAIAFYSLGTILCATANSTAELIIYRIIQAFGSCGMLAIGFAIVRDMYHGDEAGEIYSYLSSAIAFSPMFAPFIGSYLDIHFGWPSTFLSLLLVSIAACIALRFYLPETLTQQHRRRFDWGVFREYYLIFIEPIFFFYTLATAMGLSYLYLFCSISPYIIIRLLHIPEIHYGWYFAFMGISFFLGGIIAAQSIKHIGIFYTCMAGFIITLIGGLIMALWYEFSGLSIHNFIWPMLLIGIGGTVSMSAGTGGSMEPYADTAGAAAALGGAFRFMFASLVGAIVITKSLSSTLPLAVPAIIFSIVGILLFLFILKKRI